MTKAIAIVQNAKKDIHFLHCSLSMVEFIDDGIVIDEYDGTMKINEAIDGETITICDEDVDGGNQNIECIRDGTVMDEINRFILQSTISDFGLHADLNLMKHTPYLDFKDGEADMMKRLLLMRAKVTSKQLLSSPVAISDASTLSTPCTTSVPKYGRTGHWVHAISNTTSLKRNEKLLVVEEFGAKRPEPKPQIQHH